VANARVPLSPGDALVDGGQLRAARGPRRGRLLPPAQPVRAQVVGGGERCRAARQLAPGRVWRRLAAAARAVQAVPPSRRRQRVSRGGLLPHGRLARRAIQRRIPAAAKASSHAQDELLGVLPRAQRAHGRGTLVQASTRRVALELVRAAAGVGAGQAGSVVREEALAEGVAEQRLGERARARHSLEAVGGGTRRRGSEPRADTGRGCYVQASRFMGCRHAVSGPCKCLQVPCRGQSRGALHRRCRRTLERTEVLASAPADVVVSPGSFSFIRPKMMESL
jgi:hypothetical protein